VPAAGKGKREIKDKGGEKALERPVSEFVRPSRGGKRKGKMFMSRRKQKRREEERDRTSTSIRNGKKNGW